MYGIASLDKVAAGFLQGVYSVLRADMILLVQKLVT
jgi:hypothetical protein